MISSPTSLHQSTQKNRSSVSPSKGSTEQALFREKQLASEMFSSSSKLNQTAEGIDNNTSSSFNPRQNPKNSTSMSVTSKNITTANYLNQNNQFITSQPLPFQKEPINLLNTEGQVKNGLEELERKLLELEKSTQIKQTSTTSFQTDLIVKKNAQGESEVQKRSRSIQNETENRFINSNYEHILKAGVDFDNNGDSSPLINQGGESIKRREESSTQDFRGSNVRNYVTDEIKNHFEHHSSESEEKSQNRSLSKFQGNTPTGSQTRDISRFEGSQRINHNIDISEYGQRENVSSPVNNSHQNSQNFTKNGSNLVNEGLEHVNTSSKASMNSNQIVSRDKEEFFLDRSEGKKENKKQSQQAKGVVGLKTSSLEGRTSDISPLDNEAQDEGSQPDKSPSDRSIVEMESEDYQTSANEVIQTKQNSASLSHSLQNNMGSIRRNNTDKEERNGNEDNSPIENQNEFNSITNINKDDLHKQRLNNYRNSNHVKNEETHQSEFKPQQNFSKVNPHNASSSNHEQIQAEDEKVLSKMSSVAQSKGSGSPYSGQYQRNQFNNKISYQDSAEVYSKNIDQSPVYHQQISQGGSTHYGIESEDNQEQIQNRTFKEANLPYTGQGQISEANNQIFNQELSGAQNRSLENRNTFPQQISQSGVSIRGNSSEYAKNENGSQEVQKSKVSASKDIHGSYSNQRRGINSEDQEDNFENQGYYSGGRTVQKQNSQNSGSLGMINKELEVISEEKPAKSSSKKSKKKQQKEANLENWSSDPSSQKNYINSNNKSSHLPETREDHSNVYSVYSRSNSQNQEDISGTLKSNPDVDKTPRDEKRISQSFKIQSESNAFERQQQIQQGDGDYGNEGNQNLGRLSKMTEEQAAAFYEQRKNDIQKSMKKISKKSKKSAKKDLEQPRITPTHKEKYNSNQIMVTSPGFETYAQKENRYGEMETNEEGGRFSHNIIPKSNISGKDPVVSPQKKKKTKSKSIISQSNAEGNIEIIEHEAETSQKAQKLKRVLNEDRDEINRRDESQGNVNSTKVKKSEKNIQQNARQPRDNLRTQEDQRNTRSTVESYSPHNRSQERSADFRKSTKKTMKEGLTHTIQRSEHDIKSKDKVGNAIQVAREGILLRMENIEKALEKEDKQIVKDVSAKGKGKVPKHNLKVNEIEISEGRNQVEVTTPVGQKKILNVRVSSGGEVSATKSPQSIQKGNQLGKKEVHLKKIESQYAQDYDVNSDHSNQASLRDSTRGPHYSKTSKQNDNIRIQESQGDQKTYQEQNRINSSEQREWNSRTNVNNREISRNNQGEIVKAQVRNERSPQYSTQNSERTPANSIKDKNFRENNDPRQTSQSVKGNHVAYDEIPSTSQYHQNRMRSPEQANNELPKKNIRTLTHQDSSSKPATLSTRGSQIAIDEVPANSNYHQKQLQNHLKLSEQANNEIPKNKRPINRQESSTKSISLSTKGGVAYDEIPSNSQYQNNLKQLDQSNYEQPIKKRVLNHQDSNTEKSVDQANRRRNPISNLYGSKERRAESSSPNPIFNQRVTYNIENSFDERTRLFVIRKNQRLAENERKQYAQEQLLCTFTPFSGKDRNPKLSTSNSFYERNIEWSEKVKSENLIRMEKDLEEKQKREPRKPRQKIGPFSPSNSIMARRPVFTQNLETLKNDPEFQNSSANQNLKAYLDYEWNDNLLKEEINEIEDLYKYVKTLVKNKLDQTNTANVFNDPLQKQNSLISERQRRNSFTYKHKNPISRTSSFDEKSQGRMQSLKTIFYNKEALKNKNPQNPQKRENTEISNESQIKDYLKNRETKRIEIINNQYVVVDTQNFE